MWQGKANQYFGIQISQQVCQSKARLLDVSQQSDGSPWIPDANSSLSITRVAPHNFMASSHPYP